MFSAVSLVLFLIIPVFSTADFAYCESVPGLQLRIVAKYHLEGYLTGTDPNFASSEFCNMNSRISTIRNSDTALYHDPGLNTDLFIIDVPETLDETTDCLNTLERDDTMTLKGSGFTHNLGNGLKYINPSTGDCATATGEFIIGSNSGYQINVNYVAPSGDTITKTFVIAKSRGLATTGPTGPRGSAGAEGSQGPQGDKGDTGEQGPAGADGAIGPAGPAGINGTNC